MTTSHPMAFYHGDGIEPAWQFATKYAGPGGHIATLPEIIEARLASGAGDLPWESYFTTNSAEYYGIGEDGSEKLIVAHGVGPMSTLQGVKKAYAWEYKDTSRRNNGGRISAEEFLALEAGSYGEVAVIDLNSYLRVWRTPFSYPRTLSQGLKDSLLLARLGPKASHYLRLHDQIARGWLRRESIKLAARVLVQNEDAPNSPYTTFPRVGERPDFSKSIPRPLENGLAMGHLLSTSSLAATQRGGQRRLLNSVGCHEWHSGVRLVGVPSGVAWQDGLVEAPQPSEVLRRDWMRLRRPNTDKTYVLPRLCRIEQAHGEWFTHYPKPIGQKIMDSGEIEFHVRSVTPQGTPKQFQVDDDFFLRYDLIQVIAIAPSGAGAYEIVDVSTKDSRGLTTVTVQFYNADVDISHRLPRVDEIKLDYDLLMG